MQRLYPWLHERPQVFDKIALGFCVLLALPFAVAFFLRGDVAAALLSLLLCVPLWYRSRYPVAVIYATAAVGFAAILVCPFPPFSGLFAAMVMTYTAAAYAPRRHAWAALALAVAGGAASAVRWPGASLNLSDYRDIVLQLLLIIAGTGPLMICWLWGDVVRGRHAYLQEALDRAERLEREREALARVAVVEERARIAREMHDVVAHSLSVVILQADGAAYMLDTDPQRAAKALAAISRTGREALTEMRRLLGVLRTNDDAGSQHQVELGPQPGLARIDELVEQIRDAGLQVRLEVTGDPAWVPASVGLSAYRIVQEALTNAVKHGGPDTTAVVRLDYQYERLLIEVTDDGRGAAALSDGRGHGVIGMRERVSAVGGRLVAGPRPGGGFAVSAYLPYRTAEVSHPLA